MNEIDVFIKRFKHTNPSIVEDLFLFGDCYYFSIILKERFKNAIIKYMVIDNHFITEVSGRLYDIRGDVTDLIDKTQMVDWDNMKNIDELLYKRIVRDCINFE